MNKEHSVYVLIKHGNPVYVGYTSNIKRRINRHKKDKSFDGYIVIKTYENKELALNAESSIIRFLSIFKNSYNVNAKYDSLVDSILTMKRI